MADTLTPNILLTNQEAGANNNTWGDIADANFERIDDVLGDTTVITTSGGTTVLTSTQELVAIIEVNGTLAANAVLQFSGRGGFWIVRNNTSGNFTLTCKVSGQTGVQIDQGAAAVVDCDGTDIRLSNPFIQSPQPEVTIASAATTNVLGANSEFVAISGTATITSLGTGANRKRFVRATGAFTLTHNATSLILPGGKNITAAAGDTFIVISDASSNARIHNYQRASGQALVSSLPIGIIMDWAGLTAPTNWLLCSGGTVGNSASGATLRASNSPDTQTLFSLLWDSFGNAELPIQDSAGTATVRGASAAADFAANKRMPVPDLRGRVVAGKDNMGGTSANRLTGQSGGVNGDTLGATGGAETHTLTQAQLPNVNLTAQSNGAHTHFVAADGSASSTGLTTTQAMAERGDYGGASNDYLLGRSGASATLGLTSSNGAHTHTVPLGGSGAAHNNLQPTYILSKIIYAGLA
jgi:microcystin-dependent protein